MPDCHILPPNNVLIYHLKGTLACSKYNIVCSTIEKPKRTGSKILNQVTQAKYYYTLRYSIARTKPKKLQLIRQNKSSKVNISISYRKLSINA